MKLAAPYVVGLFALIPVSQAAQLEDLGSLPDGSFLPRLISQDGSVIAGNSSDPQGGVKVGVWTRGSGLALLDAGSTGSFAATAMGADGSRIAGDETGIGPNEARRPMLWDLAAGTRTGLGILPGFDTSSVVGMSADGSTVVGICQSFTSPDSQSFRWTAAGGLQALAPGVIFRPTSRGVSADGTTIVGRTVPANNSNDYRAAIWSASAGVTAIPGLPDAFSYATCVSDDGLRVVGVVDHPSFPSGVFYFQPGLGAFPVQLEGNEGNPGVPVLISADGSTVVLQARVGGSGRAATWTLGGGPEILTSGAFSLPTSVSADGATVTGFLSSSLGADDFVSYRWEESGQVTLLDSIVPGLATSASAVSRDGSTVCGNGRVDPISSRREGARWSFNGEIGESYCGPSVPNSSGVSAVLRLSGTNVIARGDLLLRATGLPSMTFGFFLVSRDSAFVTGVPGSQGNLCLGGAVGRFVGPGQVLQSSFFGDMTLGVDPRALPSPTGPFTAVPGESLYFQAWFRDANPGNTSNFTSGATVPVF